jgi:hypothetical protein
MVRGVALTNCQKVILIFIDQYFRRSPQEDTPKKGPSPWAEILPCGVSVLRVGRTAVSTRSCSNAYRGGSSVQPLKKCFTKVLSKC